jgi:hypothetical protein
MQLMPVEEHHAPGFYYIVRWRRLLNDAIIDPALLDSTSDEHDSEDSSNEYEERTIDAATDSLTLISQPVYKAYKIIVLAANEIGEAVSKPVPVIGFSSEAGTCCDVWPVFYIVYWTSVLAMLEGDDDSAIHLLCIKIGGVHHNCC